MFVTIIAQHRCIVNINAIVLLTLYQKYYGEKLLYQRSTYGGQGFFYKWDFQSDTVFLAGA